MRPHLSAVDDEDEGRVTVPQDGRFGHDDLGPSLARLASPVGSVSVAAASRGRKRTATDHVGVKEVVLAGLDLHPDRHGVLDEVRLRLDEEHLARRTCAVARRAT